jgi:hypothetical protein
VSKYDPAQISSDEGIADAPTKKSLEELEKQYQTTKLFNRPWKDMGEFVDLMAQPNARIEGNIDATLNPASYNDMLIDSAIYIHGTGISTYGEVPARIGEKVVGLNPRMYVDSILCFDLSSCCVPVDGYFLLFIQEAKNRGVITKVFKLKQPRVFAYVKTNSTLHYGKPKRKRTDRWYATVGRSNMILSPLSPKQLKNIKIKGTLSWNATLTYSEKQYNINDVGSEELDANMYDATFLNPQGSDYPMPSIFNLEREYDYDWNDDLETNEYIYSECRLNLPFLQGSWKGLEKGVDGEIGKNYSFKIDSSVKLSLPYGYKLLPYTGYKIDEVGEKIGNLPYGKGAEKWNDLSFRDLFQIFRGKNDSIRQLRGDYECNLGLDVEGIFSLQEGSVAISDEGQHPSYQEMSITNPYQNRGYDFNERKTSFGEIYTSAWANMAKRGMGQRYTFDEYAKQFFNRYEIINPALTLLPQEIMVYQPKNTYGLLNKTVL